MATIYCGNALEVLKALPDESVQMAMTSPAYWGLRNYAGGSDLIWGGDVGCQHEWGNMLILASRHKAGETNPGKTGYVKDRDGVSKNAGQFCSKCGCWRGQLGLEPTPELYVEHLMMIFQEVKRVLRKDGSLYLNIGDTYVSGKGSCFNPGGGPKSWQSRVDSQKNYPTGRDAPNLMYKAIPPKCMVCIPERVLFAMLGDGWILRNKIIWHKPNSMPSSVKDRFTQSWEYLYFFTKARKYFFNLDAVRQPHKTLSLERYQRGVNLGRPAEGKSGEVGPMTQYTRAPEWFKEMFPSDTDYKGKFDDLFGHGPQPQSFNLRVRDVKRGKVGAFVQDGEVKELKASDKEIEEYEYPEKMQRHHGSGPQYRLTGLGRGTKHHGASMNNQGALHRDRQKHEDADLGAQKPVRGKHSGYFSKDGQPLVDFAKGKNPGDLWSIPTKPSSISVCPQCDAVFPRLMKICPKCKIEGVVGHFAPYPETLCEEPIKASSKVGDTVLDMFAGSGTTGVAAKRLGRKSILIDCVKPYCIMAKYKVQRIEYQPDLFKGGEHSS